MQSKYRYILRSKIVDGVRQAPLPYTKRDVYLPKVPGKALSVMGMRRSGKTTFLWQCLNDRLKRGLPREALLYLNFEDERLLGMTSDDLQYVLEEYYAMFPERRNLQPVTFFLDEVQLIEGWERFVRRLLDTEKIEIFLSGSSATLLSREIATSMRGRAMEVLVHPFSFREVLRHQGVEPTRSIATVSKEEMSLLTKRFRHYLMEGGFPEAQGLTTRDQDALLQTYVDVAVLRDVIERYKVTNIVALRYLLRHLLANPAGDFSVEKLHRTLKSQGIAVSKTTLHEYLAHLESSFLTRVVSLHTASERQRMIAPRKAYPSDTGLIRLYERSGRANLGHALETAVYLELERRGCEIGYLRTPQGYEVDFFVHYPLGDINLIQVSTDIGNAETYTREVRALIAAQEIHPDAKALLLTYDHLPPSAPLPPNIIWQPALSWLLTN